MVEVHGKSAMDGYSPVEIQNLLEQEMKTEDTRGVMLSICRGKTKH
ncbi:hypothetical protein KHA80_08215 [Anaerobacillus sp. HL2]|nr:hypothetical protein KHA80_08215 [Anaerobacillus sp. HL2]